MFLPLRRYAEFHGRSRRREYWLWVLFKFLLGACLVLLAGLMGISGHIGGVGVVALLRMLIFFAILIPDIAVSVRRMHDINRSGWWIMMPVAVGAGASALYLLVAGGSLSAEIQTLVAVSQTNDPELFLSGMTALIVPMIWVSGPILLAKIVTLVFRCTPGTHGDNRFGPDPKASHKGTPHREAPVA
jgi:uncharacterized membrane protein YhaH (DUF805 family)